MQCNIFVVGFWTVACIDYVIQQYDFLLGLFTLLPTKMMSAIELILPVVVIEWQRPLSSDKIVAVQIVYTGCMDAVKLESSRLKSIWEKT